MFTYAWAIMSVGWLALIAVVALITNSWRPAATPPSYTLRDEPPAVVSVLARKLRHAGYAATLLDLAARGCFSMEEAGPGLVMCRVWQAEPAAGLADYEMKVLSHIAQRADASGSVPAAALGSGFGPGDKEFAEQFRAEVRADATHRGLVRKRISAGAMALIALAGLAPAITAAIALSHIGALPDALVVGWCYVMLMILPGLLRADVRLTRQGRAALAEWLGFRAALIGGPGRLTAGTALLASGGDRRIAYAAALGAAPDAVQAFVADDRRPWSAYGGSWRRVEIGSPNQHFVPSSVLLGYCVALNCLLGLMVLGIWHTGGIKWAAIFALFPGVIFWGTSIWLFRRAARARELPPVLEFNGQVLKKWTEQGETASASSTPMPRDPDTGVYVNGTGTAGTIWCVAIDDGQRERAWSLTVSEDVYANLSAGSIVHVRVDARRNKLLELV